MAVNETYSPACQEPVAYGLLDLRIAAPAYTWSGSNPTINALIPLGTAVDTIDVQNKPFFFDIHSDKNAGQQGPPSEIQYIGEIAQISLALTTWNQTAINLLRRHATANATRGTILQSEIGKMMFKNHSVRLLINTLDTDNVRNFWCCLVREPFALGMGTKWAEYRLNFTAYRPPCYHPKAGILEDTDYSTGNSGDQPSQGYESQLVEDSDDEESGEAIDEESS